MSLQNVQDIPVSSPFNLSSDTAYVRWREERLASQPSGADDLMVNISDPFHLSNAERQAIIDRCARYNMALYHLEDNVIRNKELVHAIAGQLKMFRLDANLESDDDGISSLEDRPQTGNQYIPYTNKALSWHTDGYYNRLDKQIFGIILHCVSPADKGGVSRLLNPEIIYIELRDKNPAWIEALMHPGAMTIPENIEAGSVIRPAQSGPVFMVKPDGRLHMRYSARKRNIVWRDTPETGEAVAMINAYLAEDDNVTVVKLQAGEGIICNNVLHNRNGFTDSDTQKRLMYRARFYDAVFNSNEK